MYYQQAHYIASKIIPEHPDYEAKIRRYPSGPISLLYSDVLDFFRSTDKKNQVEELEDRLLYARQSVEEDHDHLPYEPFPTDNGYLSPAPQSRVEPWSTPVVSSHDADNNSYPPKFTTGNVSNRSLNITRKPVRTPPIGSDYPAPLIMFSSKTVEPQLHYPSAPKHNVSLPRSASSLNLSNPDLQLPITNVINSETLDGYMSKFPENILFLDIRPRTSFDARRFPAENVVCIDPLSLRDNMNEIDLETALRGSPVSEQKLFQRRNSFQLVVFYDDSTTKLENTVSMQRLVDCIYTRAYLKPLKRAPCLLVGGLQAWVECLGQESVWKTLSPAHSFVRTPPSIPPSFSSNGESPNYMRGVSDYFRSNSFGTSSPEYTMSTSLSNTHLSPSTQSHQHLSPPVAAPAPVVRSSQVRHKPYSVEQHTLQHQQLSFREFATGLANLGNTCYMNCILQCLVGTPRLSEVFYRREYRIFPESKLGYQGQLANVFARLVTNMYQAAIQAGRGRVSYISPRELKFVAGQLNESYQGSNQQDCQEFLNFILDGLHEDMNARGNKPPLKPLTEREEMTRESMDVRDASHREWMRHLNNNDSLISKHVQGQYYSRLQCRVCGCQSTTYNAFSCLSIPIRLGYREVPLEDCFRLFTQPELLEGDDAWNCPRCKKSQAASKAITLSRLPDILVVHLKRFAHTGGVWGSNKLGTHVTFPSELDLSSFCIISNNGGSNDHSSSNNNRYRLYAVANHYGSLKGGHYTSYVKREGSLGWCLYDDTRVRAHVNFEEVVNKNAYVLFYERIH